MRTNVRKSSSAIDADNYAICAIPCFDGELVRKLKDEMPAPHVLEEARGLFAALSDRTRIKLLLALGSDRELCVCDLAHVAGTTFSTASHHLRKLRDLRLLRHRNDGRMSYYALRDPRLAQLVTLVLGSARDYHE
jgi:DNA-binding transcriptional ArsR family regulator